jgi:glycosyltransferase involved in cell wall biosynthesis
LIADTPEEFAGAVDKLVLDDGVWMDISRAGRDFVERHFDWHEIGSKLDGIMRELDHGS